MAATPAVFAGSSRASGRGEMLIAFLGTRGVPARYGGFETAVEEIGSRLAARGHRVVVYCRGASGGREQLGMELVHLPALPQKALETLTHTACSTWHLRRRDADVAVLFNAANAPFIPAIQARGIPVATHVDGLEWRRAKWGPIGRRYYLGAEKLAARWSDSIIVDSMAMQEYYLRVHKAKSVYIPYGTPPPPPEDLHRLAELGLTPRCYHLVVARLEPENHVHVIVEGFRRSPTSLPLVVVGGVRYGRHYQSRLESTAGGDRRVRFVGGIYDQELLDHLYGGARSYLHGHSVGGTNPSLLRAMAAGAPVVAFDVVFNREVAGDTARYFSTAQEVAALLEESERDLEGTEARGRGGQRRALERYNWERVTDEYERLCHELALAGPRRGRVPRPGAGDRWPSAR